jgi:hypothetical protein
LSAHLARLVPTLTEVLEVSELQAVVAAADVAAVSDVDKDDQLRQAVLGIVDAAIDEFRVRLLAQLEPLLVQGQVPLGVDDNKLQRAL